MPKQLLNDEIARAKTALHNKPLAAPHHEELSQALAEIELHLQTHETFDPKVILGLLHDWENRLAAEHPTMAGIINNLTKVLGDIGL